MKRTSNAPNALMPFIYWLRVGARRWHILRTPSATNWNYGHCAMLCGYQSPEPIRFRELQDFTDPPAVICVPCQRAYEGTNGTTSNQQ